MKLITEHWSQTLHINIGNCLNGNNSLMRECQFIGRFNDLARAPNLER